MACWEGTTRMKFSPVGIVVMAFNAITVSSAWIVSSTLRVLVGR